MQLSRRSIFFLAGAGSLVIIIAFLFLFSSPEDSSEQAKTESGNLPMAGEAGKNLATEGAAGNGSSNQESEINLVAPQSSRSKNFQWYYGGRSYAISYDFSGAIYDIYSKKPKEYTYLSSIPNSEEDKYYGKFVSVLETGDTFFSDISQKIVAEGRKSSLTEDQLVELTMAFVQSISFDGQKASNIKTRSGNEKMNYPYETLYENKGVSFDKSFLAVALLRELGYGAALFVYDGTNHMAAAVQCTSGYSNYGSGYCFAETTANSVTIGTIPELDTYSGKALNPLSSATQKTKLGPVGIFQKTKGKTYSKIVQTVKSNTEIKELENKISSKLEKLEDLKEDMNDEREDAYEEAKDSDEVEFSQECQDFLESEDEAIDYDAMERCKQEALSASEEGAEDYEDYKDAREEYREELLEYIELLGKYNSLTGK